MDEINIIKEEVNKMYPYFEDMNDIEIVQTNAKRNCATQIFEWLEEHLHKYQLHDSNSHEIFTMIIRDYRKSMEE